MKCISRWLVVVVILLAPVGFLSAEKVSTLPAPTGFVNDFAGVLSPAVKQNIEDLCIQVDRKAHAQIAVVTVKTIDDDMSIEEFATALEDKWKVGPKGTDRGVLMIFVMTPRKGRIEVGYGLEGILNDAKVGDIGRAMVPAASQGDYDTAITLGVRLVAQVIANDAGVTLTAPSHQYHRQVQYQPVHLSLTQIVLGGAAILLLLFFLVKTGNIGLIFFLLANIMGGGGRGGGGGRDRDDNGGGGGFGGFGGGSSGGGGASGDF
jgi:uncharacterized protein